MATHSNPLESFGGAYPAILERQIRVRAPKEELFAYFTDAEKMKQWQGIDAQLDPRPGGVYWINVTGTDILSGEYVLVEPPDRIVLKWGWETPGHPIKPSSTDVELTFTQEGEITRVLIRHAGIPAAMRQDMGVGWQHYLTRLAVVAMGRDPGRDPWIDEGGPPLH